MVSNFFSFKKNILVGVVIVSNHLSRCSGNVNINGLMN